MASMHTPKKSTNISSTIGRMPSEAAPTAAPMKAVSEIGVSRTRTLPNSSCRPRVLPNTPPSWPMSSPITNTRGSRRISWATASAMARATVSFLSFTAVDMICLLDTWAVQLARAAGLTMIFTFWSLLFTSSSKPCSRMCSSSIRPVISGVTSRRPSAISAMTSANSPL
ncbi:hypothetical protein D3C85_1097130 [compost metagenome]